MSVDRSTLEVKTREGSGKGASRRLRVQGLIPAVVYGRHLETPVHIAVNPRSIREAIATPHKFNTLITLKLTGGEKQVLLKDYQQDPLTRELLHVDFIDVRENEQVKVKVPLILTGKAVGTSEGGVLQQTRRELELYALPRAIPEKIEVDVSHLKIAQVLHINDVKLPEGVAVKSNVNYTLAVVSAPEREEAVVPSAAAAPAAEGKAATPAADGKAAAGAKKEEPKKDEKKK